MQPRPRPRSRSYALLGIVALLLVPSTSPAGLIFTVNVDTSQLTGPYTVAFDLIDGPALGGDANNTITISQFQFGGGVPAGAPHDLAGGAGGSLSSAVSLTDSDFFNSFQQDVTGGSELSFLITMSTNVGPGEDPTIGGTPDSFAFSILTIGGASSALLLSVDITPTPPPIVINTYSSTDPGLVIPRPRVQVVPEPSSIALLAIGLACGTLLRRRLA